MHKLLIAAGAAAFLAASPLAALADEAKGVIASVDIGAGTVSLESGETFILPESFDEAVLNVGEEVTIEYQTSGSNDDKNAISIQLSTQ